MRHIKQLDTNHWIKGVARDAAILKATPKELCSTHGIQFDWDEGGWGLGDVEMALLETRSRIPFGLIRYPKAPRNDYTAIVIDEKLDDATSLLNEIMCELGLSSPEFHWFNLSLYNFLPCTLLRQDDHGNCFEIAIFDCYPDAFLELEKLTARGHKQSYFIQRGDPQADGWTGSWWSNL